METAKKVIAILFGICVLIFSMIAILGIWDVIEKDISMKALSTLGIILIATFISSVIINNLDKKK